MSALLDTLRTVSAQTGPNTVYTSLLFEKRGPPTDTSPLSCLFYYDTAADKIYINTSRTAAAIRPVTQTWLEVNSGDALNTTGTVLTATT